MKNKTETEAKILSKYRINSISAVDIIDHIPAILTCEENAVALLTADPMGTIDGSVWYRDVNRRECGYIRERLESTKGCLQVKLGGNPHEASNKDLDLYISKP